jgi:hydrogenase nickel incorporation protein HypB
VALIARSLLEKNDALAAENRGAFRANNLLVLNVVSSPGSGKTTLLRETAAKLSKRLRVGVIVGDLATDNDAAQLRRAGVPVVQITTERFAIWMPRWSPERPTSWT